MKITVLICLITISLSFFSCDLLDSVGTGGGQVKLSESQVIDGLKQALILGSKTAAFTLSDTSGSVNDLNEMTGYLANELIRISLPTDVANAFTMLEKLSGSTVGQTLLAVADVNLASYKDALVLGLNRGAERAAGLSVDVFTDAITGMTLTSAKQILFSSDSTSATNYLNEQTGTTLKTGFTPIIDSSLGIVQVSFIGNRYPVKTLWSNFSTEYNKVAAAFGTIKTNAASSNILVRTPALASLTLLQNAGISSVDPLNTNLVDYATDKALVGLFYTVGVQEKKIRRDPVAALSAVGKFITDTIGDLIEKIFTSSESDIS